MGRQTRTPLPTHRRLLIPQAMEPKTVVKALKNQQKAASAIYNKNSRDIPTLEAGDHVRITKIGNGGKQKYFQGHTLQEMRGVRCSKGTRDIYLLFLIIHQNTTVPGQPAVHVARKSPNHVPIRTPAVPGQPAVHIEHKSPTHVPIRTPAVHVEHKSPN